MKNDFLTVFAAVLVFFTLLPFAAAHENGKEDSRGGAGLRRREGGEAAREAASRRMREIERKRTRIREEIQDEISKIRELAQEHRRAKTDVEKDTLRKELKNILEKGFERRHSALRERLEELRNECDEIERKMKQNIERKDEIIEMRLERILSGPRTGRRAPGAGSENSRQKEENPGK